MRPIAIKDIVAFQKKSDRSKKTFVNNQKKELIKKMDDGTGGNYWTTSLSALGNSYKFSDLKHVRDKLIDLEERFQAAKRTQTKNQHRQNINILENYQDFDIKKWRPGKNVTIEPGGHVHAVMTVNGLPIKVSPTYVIRHLKNEQYSLGAIWFVAKKGGYSKSDVGMFTEMLYRFVAANFEENGILINPKYCIAVDAFSNTQVSYQEIQNGEVPSVLENSLDEIKAFF
jgi:hypothetical protein